MNGLQPSHEIRKLTIVLPAHVVDALRSQLRGDETITDCIKRLVIREALGVGVAEPEREGLRNVEPGCMLQVCGTRAAATAPAPGPGQPPSPSRKVGYIMLEHS